jgi:hypothetical protein
MADFDEWAGETHLVNFSIFPFYATVFTAIFALCLQHLHIPVYYPDTTACRKPADRFPYFVHTG